MPLKITLKPRERLILGGAVVRNGNPARRICRWKTKSLSCASTIFSASAKAGTPCRRIYFVVQLMYVDERNLAEHHACTGPWSQDLLAAAPSTARYTDEISRLVVERKYYQALKVARQLIDYEQELLETHMTPYDAYVNTANMSMSDREIEAEALTKAAAPVADVPGRTGTRRTGSRS